jgi:hypothetical protein
MRYILAVLLVLAAWPAQAQLQPGPNIIRGLPYTFSPRAGYLGPPAPMPLPPRGRVRGAPPPAAPEVHYATHNGSLMAIVSPAPGEMVITYSQPRPNLYGLVMPGTLLVQGTWQGQTFAGTAWVFSSWCGAIPYPVNGNVDGSGALMLFGPAPQFDTACNILGYAIASQHAVLRFEPVKP